MFWCKKSFSTIADWKNTHCCVCARERESKITDVKFFLFMQRDKKWRVEIIRKNSVRNSKILFKTSSLYSNQNGFSVRSIVYDIIRNLLRNATLSPVRPDLAKFCCHTDDTDNDLITSLGQCHCSTDLLFYLFGFSWLAFFELTTALLVRSNPNQSKWKSATQQFFPFQSFFCEYIFYFLLIVHVTVC